MGRFHQGRKLANPNQGNIFRAPAAHDHNVLVLYHPV
jgi:hypothetical protein